jgi:Beta-galactosidase
MSPRGNHRRGILRGKWLPTMAVILVGAATVVGVVAASGSGPGSSRSSRGLDHRTAGRNAEATSGDAGRGSQLRGAAGVTTLSDAFRPEALIAHGIYEFGTNSGVDAADPDLAGTTLTFQWSQLESGPGTFEWARVNQAIAPWAAAGKHVILRVSTAGQASWGAAAANATPQWVYAQGVPAVHDKGATLPVYWNATYLRDYDGFVRAFAAQFDGDPVVSFIEMGIGDGGETLPDTQEGPGNRYAMWTPHGYSDQTWLDTIENIATTYRTDFHFTPVVPLVDSSFLGQGQGADYAKLTSWFVANGFPMQYDGLTSTSAPQNASWGKTETIMEQRNPTSSSGDSLAGDCAEATGPRESKVILIYQADVDNAANRPSLSNCAHSVAP